MPVPQGNRSDKPALPDDAGVLAELKTVSEKLKACAAALCT
jgi:hypothetical protein